MASSSLGSNEPIHGINVTPLVDVVLVLLVVLMVSASYLAARAIPVNLPRGATGESQDAPLAVSIDAKGRLFLDAVPVVAEELRRRIRERRARGELRALIAADGAVPHRDVVSVIDLLRQERVVEFAINVNPSDLDGREK